MMGAVHTKAVHFGNTVEQCARDNPDSVAGFIARVRLAMRDAIGHLVRDVLDQSAAERNIEELLATANSEHRHAARQRSLRRGELEGGAAVLGLDRRVLRGRSDR